jgi:hypothetical protein
MGFNITQIINKFVPTKRVDDDLRENPYGTKQGQEVVSIAENFWVRMAREGRPLSGSTNTTAVPNNSTFIGASLNADVDCIIYPRFVSVSCTVDAELIIQFNPNVPHAFSHYLYRGFAKAGTPVLLKLDGEIQIASNLGGGIKFGATNTGTTSGILIGNIFGYEVNMNV